MKKVNEHVIGTVCLFLLGAYHGNVGARMVEWANGNAGMHSAKFMFNVYLWRMHADATIVGRRVDIFI